MIHEVTELVADHLADATHGVNAYLALIPLAEIDEAVASDDEDDVAPDIGAIAHEFQDDWLVAEQEPPIVPALIVVVRNAPDHDLASGHRTVEAAVGRDVLIGVTYASRDALGARARRHGSYTLRAVRQSLTWLTGHVSQDDRTLRSVTLAAIPSMQEVPLAPSQGRGGLVGMVVARATVIDALP